MKEKFPYSRKPSHRWICGEFWNLRGQHNQAYDPARLPDPLKRRLLGSKMGSQGGGFRLALGTVDGQLCTPTSPTPPPSATLWDAHCLVPCPGPAGQELYSKCHFMVTAALTDMRP